MSRLLVLAVLALPFTLTASCASTSSKDLVLCSHCGLEKGSEGCCDPTTETCADCGKIAGSPGCCK